MISSYQQVQPLFLLKASVGQAFEQCIDAQWGAPHAFFRFYLGFGCHWRRCPWFLSVPAQEG